MQTKILKVQDIQKDNENIKIAGEIIKNGGLVAIPTETVYGLAGDALNPKAVKNIFIAKGRPQDNPLIVHISDKEEATKYAKDIPQMYYDLCDRFCPGPLTIILKKKDIIPSETSGGLDTVALRIPQNKIAREIIKASGTAIAAPSANISGIPSPTNAQRCIDDLCGKIEGIVDGGECSVGVESTVISLATKIPTLYRPGLITPQQIKEVTGELIIADAVTKKLLEGEKVSSPGLKYKHYSPKANVIIIKGEKKEYCDFVNNQNDYGVYALCFTEDIDCLNKPYVCYGDTQNSGQQARLLFESLRCLDEKNAVNVYAHCPQECGVGLAVYNRLLRAAAFEVIEL